MKIQFQDKDFPTQKDKGNRRIIMRLTQIAVLLQVLLFVVVILFYYSKWDRVNASSTGFLITAIIMNSIFSVFICANYANWLDMRNRQRYGIQSLDLNIRCCTCFIILLCFIGCCLTDLRGSQSKFQFQFLQSKEAHSCKFGQPFAKPFKWKAGTKCIRYGKTNKDNCIKAVDNMRTEDYWVQNVTYIIQGKKHYGCSCFSNFANQSKWIGWKGTYESHNFEKFGDNTYKFPSWSCYQEKQIYHNKCYIRGDINQLTSDLNATQCFPSSKSDAVVVFSQIKTTWRAEVLLIFFTFVHLLLFVCICFPVEMINDERLDNIGCLCYCPLGVGKHAVQTWKGKDEIIYDQVGLY